MEKTTNIQTFEKDFNELSLEHGDQIFLKDRKDPMVFIEGTNAFIDKSNNLMVYVPVITGNGCGYNYQPFGQVIKVVRDPNHIPPKAPQFNEYKKKKVPDYIVNSDEAFSREEILTKLLESFRDYEVFNEFKQEPLPIIHYDEITVWGGCTHHADWTGPDEYEDYEVEYDLDLEYHDGYEELTEFTYEKFKEEEEIFRLISEIDEDFAIDFAEKFILSLSCLYENDVIDLFYEMAENEAQRDFDDR